MSIASIQQEPAAGIQGSQIRRFLQTLALAFLFTAAAMYEAFRLSALGGAEVWSHLRTGIWILQNHAIPHNGLFSQYLDSPWVAHSWIFDLVLAAAYQCIGLRALPVLLMLFKAAIAVTLFLLARGSWYNLWPALLLTAFAQYAISNLQLQPVLCSALLFAGELCLLFDALRTGSARRLPWLLLLFALWANLDIGFVYGLFLLGWFVTALTTKKIVDRWKATSSENGAEPFPLGVVGAIAGSCFVVTLLPPYGFHRYEAIAQVFDRSTLFRYLPELHGAGFRQPGDFVLLLLTATAFFSLGRHHSLDLFKLGVLISSAMVSFSAERDSWIVVVVSVAVIADAVPVQKPASGASSLWQLRNLGAAGLVLLILLPAIDRIPSSRGVLLGDVGKTFPVAACDYIRANNLPGPLFNAYEWGGFLTWYLPEYPVVIDSRQDLYGDEINVRYFKLTNSETPLNADLHFAYARTILLQRRSAMAVALSAEPQFTVRYQDNVAMVLAPRG